MYAEYSIKHCFFLQDKITHCICFISKCGRSFLTFWNLPKSTGSCFRPLAIVTIMVIKYQPAVFFDRLETFTSTLTTSLINLTASTSTLTTSIITRTAFKSNLAFISSFKASTITLTASTCRITLAPSTGTYWVH